MHSTHFKLFALYTALIFVIMLIMCIAFYYNVLSNAIEKEISQTVASAENVCSAFDTKIEQLSSASIRCLYFDKFKELFYSLDYLQTSENLLIKRDLSDIVYSTSGPLLPFYQANFVNRDSRAFFCGNNTSTGRVYGETIRQIDWFDKALSLNGKLLILKPHYDDFNHSNGKYYSIVRSFSLKNNSTADSVVEIQDSYKNMSDLINRTASDDFIFIFDDKGELFNIDESPDNRNTKLFNELYNYQDYRLYNNSPRSTSFEIKLHNSHYIIGHAYSSYTNMHIWTVRDIGKSVISLLSFQYPTMLVFILSFVIAVIVAYLFAYRVTLPIRTLKSRIASIRFDDLNKPPHFNKSKNSELEEINKSFEDLYQRLNISMQNAIELRSAALNAKLTAYQMQMGPHFIYNILNIIFIHADKGDVSEVGSMCNELISLLRYISSVSPGEMVTVEDELVHTLHYVNLMTAKYPGKVNFETDVPAPVLLEHIPQLIIQPIVENIFKYGINKQFCYNITISGKELEDGWQLSVRDDGSGFPDPMPRVCINKDDTENSTKIGLQNIAQRLELVFSSNATIMTYNHPDGGACVTITIHNPEDSHES